MWTVFMVLPGASGQIKNSCFVILHWYWGVFYFYWFLVTMVTPNWIKHWTEAVYMSKWLINLQAHPTDTSKTRKYHCHYLLSPFPQHKSQSFAQQFLHQHHNFRLKYYISFRKTSNCDLKTASLEFTTSPKQAVPVINCLHSSCIPHMHMGTENTKGEEPSFGPLGRSEEWTSCQFYEVIITVQEAILSFWKILCRI